MLRSLETPPEDTGQGHSEWTREITEEVGSPTLCSHAFSVGGTVFRIGHHDETNADGAPWWIWQKVVEPGSIITHLSCNSEGSVIVAATDVGTVALLRGCDGRRLAYQQVSVTNVQWRSEDSLWIETDDEIILVNHIDGSQLNHETDERAVSRATRLLEMTNVSLEKFILRTFTILLSNTVVACDADRNLKILNIQNNTLIGECATHDPIIGEIDYALGLHAQETNGASVVVGCSLRQSDRVIFWFNARNNSIACTHTISNVVVTDALQPLEVSNSNEASLSLAVATRMATGAQIQILQVLVDGETVVDPHTLYTLSEEAAIVGMTIAPVAHNDCSLRYRIWTKSGGPTLKVFEPQQTKVSKLRRVRSLLARKQVDLVTEDLIAGVDEDEFSRFHPSEIVFARLCEALSQKKGAAAVSQLLRTLIAGAKTSNVGLDWLIQGIRHIIHTPSNFTLQQFHAGVSLLPRLVEPLTTSLSKENHEKLRAVLRTVGRKADALNYLAESKVETDLPFYQVRSIRHLYEVFIQEHRIDAAEDLAAKDLISLEDLVLPILHSKPTRATAVMPLLCDSIFPRLSIGDDIVPRIKHWAVQCAEQSEDIKTSVEVLEVINAELSCMHDRIHSCFGNYSPFVADLGKTDHRTNLSNDTVSLQDVSESDIDITKKARRSKAVISRAGFPTILQKSHSVTMRLTRLPIDEGTSESEDDIVLKKLTEAKCIYDARELGLPLEFTDLRRFQGVETVAKELCRTIGRDKLLRDLVPFCCKYTVDFNLVLADNIGNLCRGKDVSEATIIEACSLVYLCPTVGDKCNAALVVLRAARVFGTPNSEIFELADKSMQWAAGDQPIREELFEARRLLQIDAIIIKYCGDAARNMFRLEDPRHSLRLFQFVCDHAGRQTGVIGDAFSMCHAFNHLSEYDAAGKILESALLRQKPNLCNSLFDELVQYSRNLAVRALVRTVLTAEVIAHQSRDSDEYVEGVYDCVASLIMTAREKGLQLNSEETATVFSFFENADLREMRERLVDVVTLRRSHAVQSTLQMLRNESEIVEVVRQKVSDIVKESGQDVEQNLDASKQMCTLLCSRKVVATDIWVTSAAAVANDRLHNPQSTNSMYSLLSSSELLTPRKPNRTHSFCQSVITVGLIKTAISHSFPPEITIERATQSLAIVTDCSLRQTSFEFINFASNFFESADIVKQAMEKSDGRFAELPGAFLSKSRNCSRSTPSQPISDYDRPRLHDSWYVGDGLLLPPGETLQCALSFLVGRWQRCKGSTELASLLASKGTHFFELQVVSQAASILSFCATDRDDTRLASVQDQLADSVKAIAERSLGGTGYGITSSMIDSQNALSCLLAMNVKDAFSIFKVCIPMAIKRQSFSRLQILANIGVIASADSSRSPTMQSLLTKGAGWANQEKFNDQCAALAEKSTWWNVLSENGIEFDSKLFDTDKSSIDHGSQDLTYAESMLLILISQLLSSALIQSQVLEVSERYAKSFNLKSYAPTACMIEHLLRPVPPHELPFYTNKSKGNEVRLLLTQIQDPLVVLSLLRRCLRKLEISEHSRQDYELLAVTLDLYYENLCSAFENNTILSKALTPSMVQVFQNEKRVVESRLGALSVLSSFYQGNRRLDRPSFQEFFKPLPHRIEESLRLKYDAGLTSLLSSSEDSFDPLSAMLPLLSDLDVDSVSALAPLCSPLGLPAGFLHARWLMKQFEMAVQSNERLPGFDEAVRPVLNRLPLTLRTELANWCFANYSKINNNEKLLSLEALLECKVREATSAEEQSNLTGQRDIEVEHLSMEQLEQMTSLKNSLSRVLDVKAALLAHEPNSSRTIVQLCDELARRLDEAVTDKPNMGIDDIVDFVLRRGSALAAESCLSTSGFTLQQLRFFSEKVHRCCREISDGHNERARDLAKHWLFHGDENNLQENQVKSQLSPLQRRQTPMVDFKEDFVMDISEVQHEADAWKYSDCAVHGELDKVIVDEESSSIEPCSLRETSEFLAQRASLRIAFVMAFSEEPPIVNDKSKENLINKNLAVTRMHTHVADKLEQDDDLSEIHSKLLMGIVFAKAQLSSVETAAHSIPKDIRAITFAMRHRALRVASILCPHDTLSGVSPTCTLRKICFGVFVAKEIEEMGLTLPHSDLVQLSTMNFATYARTLWMQHRKDDLKSQGRFLLLLCEMILKESASSDPNLHLAFEEIMRRRLPRTLLLALDRVANVASNTCFNQGIMRDGIDLCVANISAELSIFTTDKYIEHQRSVGSTLKKIDNILKQAGDKKAQQDYVARLVNVIESSGGDVDSLYSCWGQKGKSSCAPVREAVDPK